MARHGRSLIATGILFTILGGAGACGRASAPPMDADQVLRRMSDVLAGAPRLSISARREADPDLREGRDLPALSSINVRLIRPHRIVVQLDSGGDHRAMFSDGDAFTLQDVTKNLYSTIALKSTLDDLDDQLGRIYGFVPPLFEFVTNHPYESIHDRVTSLTYLGEAPDALGIRCHRIAVAGEVADAELWVNATDFLPRQLTATFRTIASHPQIRLFFTAWNLAPTWRDAELAFTAPAGAMKIPMRSVAEMEDMMRRQKR